MYADVVINAPHLTTSYSYAIPDALEGQVRPGHLVTVPFGGRRAQGIVLQLSEHAAVTRVSELEELVDAEPVLTPAQIELGLWIADTYLASRIDCLTLMLPPGLAKRADTLYTLNTPEVQLVKVMPPTQQALIDVLSERGPLRGRQLDRAVPDNWRASAEVLAKRGLLLRQSVLDPPTVRAKHVRTARLAVSLTALEAARPHLSSRASKSARLSAVLDFLANDFDPVEVSWVYAETGAKLNDLKELAER